jgi:hypothetical protein
MVTRPFGLRDLSLLWYLRGRGLTLDMRRAVLWAPSPVVPALTSLLPPGYLGSTLTYVCYDQGMAEPGLVQVLASPERQEWQVIHLAPWVESEELASGACWVSVLGDICALSGAWGALRVRAGVVAGGAEEEAFRRAGFVVYTREEVYRLARPQAPAGAEVGLRPILPADAWPLLQLVNQTVPSKVQLAEGTNIVGTMVPIFMRLGVTQEQGYVLEQGEGLGAYVGVSRGPQGAWVRMLLRADARKRAAEVVCSAVVVGSPAPALYVAVRDYQVGLRGVLAEIGFEFAGVQVWLVKHNTRPACLRHRSLAVDKRREPVTTPLHPVNDTEVASCYGMTREHWMYEYRRADSCAVGSD